TSSNGLSCPTKSTFAGAPGTAERSELLSDGARYHPYCAPFPENTPFAPALALAPSRVVTLTAERRRFASKLPLIGSASVSFSSSDGGSGAPEHAAIEHANKISVARAIPFELIWSSLFARKSKRPVAAATCVRAGSALYDPKVNRVRASFNGKS